jgi:hypothetical protein
MLLEPVVPTNVRNLPVAVSLILATAAVAPLAHAADDGRFDARELFAPLQLPDAPNAFRSGSGKPGPLFWQNRADYDLKARIDPAARTLSGEETITYANRSPDTLDVLWLQLDQNIYRADAKARDVRAPRPPRPGQPVKPWVPSPSTDGYRIASVEVEQGGKRVPAKFLVDGTRMRVDLPAPLAGNGGTLKLHVRYAYTVPDTWGGRTAITPSKNGEIYEIAQWYPRMAVYDDVRGWDTQPYLGSEFYLEYGTFDYAVTVPWNWFVAGSGELLNSKDVLTASQQQRLEQARGSDKTVYIVKPDEVGQPSSRPTADGSKTWRFRMEHTRDVAFAASPAFVWDAARINLPDGRNRWRCRCMPPKASARKPGTAPPSTSRRHRAFLAVVPVPVAGGDQPRWTRCRHGIPGHRVRRVRRYRQGPVLDQRARAGPYLVPDDRRLQRAALRVHGRRLQHLH